jgi:hypothetical protein
MLVGLPNSGKSSLINALKMSAKAAGALMHTAAQTLRRCTGVCAVQFWFDGDCVCSQSNCPTRESPRSSMHSRCQPKQQVRWQAEKQHARFDGGCKSNMQLPGCMHVLGVHCEHMVCAAVKFGLMSTFCCRLEHNVHMHVMGARTF